MKLLKATLRKRIVNCVTPKVTLKDFYDKRKHILIYRNARGIGDILMHRLIFEDFKKTMPDMKLIFACPKDYHCLVKDHPFVDEVVDSAIVNKSNYVMSYDTSDCCIQWESYHAPFASKNRADLWAEHCGIKLTNPNMYLPFINNDLMQFGLFQVRQARNMSLPRATGSNVLFAPTTYDRLRTLLPEHIEGVIAWLRKQGHFVYATHNRPIPILEELNVPVLYGYSIPEWFSLIHAADYVISADTSVFHYAGGIKKPLVGIFTHVDGKYRGKYYDFVLVQKHRDNGDWPCGPCYNWTTCKHPKGMNCTKDDPRPCLTELTVKEITDGMEKMFQKWTKC
jgi:ADP-heptose:LPS heptosyltransferase